MKENKLVSIIITSYNYEQFIRYTIDSALKQTYPYIEVIVVDDGSTDSSPEMIRSYGDRITPIIKQNGGQASAFNAGFNASRGTAICFVDSDDLLMPSVIEQAMLLFKDDIVAKVHWPLILIDEHGNPTGKFMHEKNLSEGDLRDILIKYGTAGYNWPSTSGNLWSRHYLEAIFPVPETDYRIGPDVYLSTLVPFFGEIRKLETPQGCYRIHSQNHTIRRSIEKRAAEAKQRWSHSFDVLKKFCESKGIATNTEIWKLKSWWHQTALAVQEIEDRITEGDKFILIDEDEWVTGGALSNRYCTPFLKSNGHYWRPSAEDEIGVEELNRHKNLGANYLVFSSPAFWWFDYYQPFTNHLDDNYSRILDNDRLKVYDLRRKKINN